MKNLFSTVSAEEEPRRKRIDWPIPRETRSPSYLVSIDSQPPPLANTRQPPLFIWKYRAARFFLLEDTLKLTDYVLALSFSNLFYTLDSNRFPCLCTPATYPLPSSFHSWASNGLKKLIVQLSIPPIHLPLDRKLFSHIFRRTNALDR